MALLVAQSLMLYIQNEEDTILMLLVLYGYCFPASLMLRNYSPQFWERYLVHPNLEDNDSYFRSRFRICVSTLHALVGELSPYHPLPAATGRPSISLTVMILITLYCLGHTATV